MTRIIRRLQSNVDSAARTRARLCETCRLSPSEEGRGQGEALPRELGDLDAVPCCCLTEGQRWQAHGQEGIVTGVRLTKHCRGAGCSWWRQEAAARRAGAPEDVELSCGRRGRSAIAAAGFGAHVRL